MCPRSNARIQAVYRHLSREYQIDGAELDELMGAVRINLAELRDEMHRCLDEKQWDELCRVAHSVKGVASNLGQEEMRRLALVLEKESGSGAENRLRKVAAGLGRLFAELGVEE
ncbi:MAG: Hpt domain-containing protein [Kiritimatiellaeota bacterium]|nr:Hpt domain-containing protein [Kiritimatiellota bacterium]